MISRVSDFVVRYLLRYLIRRSRFVLLIEIRGDPDSSSYVFSCRGKTTPREVSLALDNVSEDIGSDMERREIEKAVDSLIRETFLPK